MFSIKREPSDGFDVGNDSQRIRLRDDNPHISDTLDMNKSENQPDKRLNEEMLLTVAYVENESASNGLDLRQ